MPLLGSRPGGQHRDGWVVGSCPLAPWTHDSGIDRNPSFGIRIESGVPHAHCFSCLYSGNLYDLLSRLRFHLQHDTEDRGIDLGAAMRALSGAEDETPPIRMGRDDDRPSREEPWPEEWLHTFPRAIDMPRSSEPREFLIRRGIDDDMAEEMDIRYDGIRHRVCWPLRDFGGRLRGLVGRILEGYEGGKYLNYPRGQHRTADIWLGEESVDMDRPVLIVEGPTDLASVRRVAGNTLAALSAGISQYKADRLKLAGRIVTLFDQGAAGDLGRDRLVKLMPNTSILHAYLERSDDPGEAGEEELREVLYGLVDLV